MGEEVISVYPRLKCSTCGEEFNSGLLSTLRESGTIKEDECYTCFFKRMEEDQERCRKTYGLSK